MSEPQSVSARPLVTVVIPTYNRADYVAETIESVLGQTYENLEIIVIDDGSTDDTASVVERYAPRVRYVWQENAERGASRNHGLRLAKGEFIAFLDSDDVWLPHKVEDDVAYFTAHPEVGVIYSDAIEIDADGKETGILKARGRSGRITRALLERNLVFMPTHLARTAKVREVSGFREERALSGSEDWEMWVRLSLVTEFAYIPKVTAKYRIHAANSMSSAAGMRRSMSRAAELFRASDSLAPYRSTFRKMDAHIALVSAINYCSQKERRESVGLLASAVRSDPRTLLDTRFGYTIFRLIKNSVLA
jgi:glycosyltransferase involved in cell wall biosynthesis